MQNISVLEKFTWPFQILGLQLFTLKSLNKNSKYPSKLFTIFGIFWIAYSLTILIFIYKDFYAVFQKAKANENYLSIVFSFINFVNFSITVLIGVALTFRDHSKFVDFFLKLEKISQLYHFEFDYKIKFKPMKKSLVISYFFFLMYNVCRLAMLVHSFKGSGVYFVLVRPICWTTISVTVQMSVMRFNFYVSVINFLLQTSADLIRENFSNRHIERTERLVKVWKVSPLDYQQNMQIKTIRKIYLLTREMADCINKTMGVIIFLRLFMISLYMIKYGYDIFSDISGAFASVGKIYCESL